MKEESELKNLIKINVANGICGDYQVWDYISMKYMDTFTGEIEAQLFWVSYDHNEGYEDWGIATHPEREKANGYLCKQVYLADFSIIDRPTPPVEVKTAEEILAKQQRSSFGNYTWERVIEAMEAYHAQFTPSAKSVEVEESAKEASKRYVDTMNLRYHRVMPAGADLIFQDGANWQQQKQAETIRRVELALRKILRTPSKSDCDLIAKEALNPKQP